MRAVVALVCLIAAPLGLWCAGKPDNPPGAGPGPGQVVVGVGIPVVLPLVVARSTGLSWREAGWWALASLALVGLLLLVVVAIVAQID